MKNVVLLKGVLSEETYNKVVEESKDSKISLADINSGEYVSKDKFEAIRLSFFIFCNTSIVILQIHFLLFLK